jgi:hypothetical protein
MRIASAVHQYHTHRFIGWKPTHAEAIEDINELPRDNPFRRSKERPERSERVIDVEVTRRANEPKPNAVFADLFDLPLHDKTVTTDTGSSSASVAIAAYSSAAGVTALQGSARGSFVDTYA